MELAKQDEIDSKKYMEFMESTLEQITSSMDLDFDTILGKAKTNRIGSIFLELDMLDEITLGIVAILAGILILIGWVPQIIQGYKTKKLEDVSRYLVIAIFAGAVLWLVYGIEVDDDRYIIGVNIAAMFLTMTVLIMKLKYEKLSESIRK